MSVVWTYRAMLIFKLIDKQSVVFMIASSEIRNMNNILFVSSFIWKLNLLYSDLLYCYTEHALNI
jgi:hypothetical protein